MTETPKQSAESPPDGAHLSQAYQTLQARLDNYRDSAISITGAVFLLLTVFDASIVQTSVQELSSEVLVMILLMTLVITVVGGKILGSIQEKFEELSGMVVRLEYHFGFYTKPFDSYYPDGSLYPQIWYDPEHNNRPGWRDFTIKWLSHAIFIVGWAHVFFVALVLAVATFDLASFYESQATQMQQYLTPQPAP